VTTARVKQYKRNRRFDILVLIAIIVLLVADPEWLGAPDDDAKSSLTVLKTGDS
jgi:hypothetical protein